MDSGVEEQGASVDDAEDPTSLSIAWREEGHAEASNGPEGYDGDRRANAVRRGRKADPAMHDRQTKDAGDYNRKADSAIEDQVDAIARDTQQCLIDEVEDGAAHGGRSTVAWSSASKGRTAQLRVPCAQGPSTSWPTLRTYARG